MRCRQTLTVLSLSLASSVQSAYVEFSNCLQEVRSETGQALLQFIPLNVTASFGSKNSSHPLNVTIYGTVAGQATLGTYPPANDPSWTDPSSGFGKILDFPDGATYWTTLLSSLDVLSYTPFSTNARFCNSTIHGDCPLAPAFGVNRSDINQLTGFSIEHNMSATYAFTEIIATMKIQSGYEAGNYYSCVNVYLTPDLGDTLRDLLRYLPLGVLIIVGIATISAAMFSPWGTWDIFRWSSNFGRDEDVLRLVTPGFGDCLQYLQFIVLAGSLSLNYPGFYQPVVSRVGWSALMFNESFVSHGNGTQPVIDGLYQYRNGSTSGLDRMTQLIGMTSPSDAWADMIVWLVIIVVSAAILTQIGFALRWAYRQIMKIPAEDFMSKNWYFTVGNVVRLAVGYFILPLVALSMYQFVIASQGPIYSIALAAVVLVAIIAFSLRLVFLFARTRPRSYLFDDLQTVLAYGPLYNTYCDDTATFALIPILVNFLRGIAIGAVQASGVAQIVLLAVSEVCFILTISAFRPYPSATSMNLYQTCFSIVRILTILLSIAFVPSLNVNGGTRGWIGYVILLIHACVLVFGFFLNAIQTLIEVIARLAGAGGSTGRDAPRGGLVKTFGVRQLSKRKRNDEGARQSMASSAAILSQMGQEQKGLILAPTRSRSISASSTMLLDNTVRNPYRVSQTLSASDGPATPDAGSTFSKRLNRYSGAMSPGAIFGLPRSAEAKDPYYRPPRRNTVDLMNDRERYGGSPENARDDPIEDRGEGSSTPARMEDFEDNNELTKTKTDYAVREVDFYYGVRGPALSSGTRKLKTGPADPTGPVSSATGWFKGIMGGRKKEKTKGFEVVRSARAPPPGLMSSRRPESEHAQGLEKELEMTEPYRDSPLKDVDIEHSLEDDHSFSEDHAYVTDIPARPPSLPLIDTVGSIELPSRVGSEASKRYNKSRADDGLSPVPSIPRRSSKRTPSQDLTDIAIKLPAVPASPPESPSPRQGSLSATPSRMPFSSSQNSPLKNRYSASARSIASTVDPMEAGMEMEVDQENQAPTTAADNDQHFAQYTESLRHNSSALGSHAVEDRPSSVGFVKAVHRASDGITHQHASSPIYEGKSAEIHGRGYFNTDPAAEASSRGNSVNPYGQPGQRSSRFRD